MKSSGITQMLKSEALMDDIIIVADEVGEYDNK